MFKVLIYGCRINWLMQFELFLTQSNSNNSQLMASKKFCTGNEFLDYMDYDAVHHSVL